MCFGVEEGGECWGSGSGSGRIDGDYWGDCQTRYAYGTVIAGGEEEAFVARGGRGDEGEGLDGALMDDLAVGEGNGWRG